MPENAADVAANLGYSMAFFNSNPELKALLNKAVQGNWTPAKFVAQLQGTTWFKKNGEAARQVWALRTSDPATYNQRLSTTRSQVASMAAQIGANINTAQIGALSANALAWGWSEQQIKDALWPSVYKNKQATGQAAANKAQISQAAANYGLNISDAQMGTWLRGLTVGSASMEAIQNSMMTQTISRYPALGERLKAGETLRDIAAPYLDTYSQVLEIPGDNLKLDDPMLKRAFAAKGQDGKPAMQSIWEFEANLKKDPRWMKTKNAQEAGMAMAHKVLQDFGLVGG